MSTARFDGKTVWITGASAGIGKAMAIAFARHGARLILSARTTSALEAVADACESPTRPRVVPLDLGAPDSIPGTAAEVLDEAGPVDILVNNAGISQRSLAAETSIEVDRRIMEVNYFGTVALTRAVLPSMRERKQGHIVTVTSLAGKFATPMRSSYSASKHALHGFMDALRAELHAEGIRVTLLCPGFVRTDISLHALTADGSAQQTMDRGQAGGMSPERFATNALRAIARGKAEAYIGRERYAVYVHRWMPGLFRRIIRSARVT